MRSQGLAHAAALRTVAHVVAAESARFALPEIKLAMLPGVDEFLALAAIAESVGQDDIDLVIVDGWQCVAKKGEFQPGDRDPDNRGHKHAASRGE